jgi:organic hydroperoxide reductase OsmC/OhrA
MMGTLAAVLAGDGIATAAEHFRADVEGDIEDVGGILRITEIRVAYRLKTEAEKKSAALLALENYLGKCPAAQSVVGCIRIAHTIDIVEN